MESIQCPSCESSSFTKQGELIECNHCGNIYQPSQLQSKVQTTAANTESVPDDPLEELQDDPLEELQDERTIKQLIYEVEQLEQEFIEKTEEDERLNKILSEGDVTKSLAAIDLLLLIDIFLLL